MFKICTGCGEEKPATAEYFYRATKEKSGLASWCKSCKKKYYEENREKVSAGMKKYYEENREKISARKKKYYEENREKILAGVKKYNEENREKVSAGVKKYNEENREKVSARKKKYYEENREKISARKKKYREENREKLLAGNKKYYEENREKILAGMKKYNEENREKVSALKMGWARKRRQEDPIFRLLHNMRARAYYALSGKQKNSRTMQYVNMTPDELMDYLEGRFTEGMTRDNYGKWHVDHIRPLASFDFTGPDIEDQLHMAWNYTNLQPLWAADNMSKGAKYISEST